MGKRFGGWGSQRAMSRLSGMQPAPRRKATRAEASEQTSILLWFARMYPACRAYSTKDNLVKGAGAAHVGTLRGYPDMVFYTPDINPPVLYVELKKPGTRLRQVRNPAKWASAHIAEQAEWLQFLRTCGFRAVFAVGEAEAREIISAHMAGQNVNEISKHALD